MSSESEHAFHPDRLMEEYRAYISDYRLAQIWRRRCKVYAWIAGIELLILIFLLR
jgi:hypothetical protein